MMKFGIHSNRVIMPHGIYEATLIIEAGTISMVIDGKADSKEVGVLDVGDSILMPGVIDPHVHINEPGREDWEGFDSATRAAAAGGITTLIEMPLNADPVTTTVEALEAKINAAQGKLHVNCGFWGGIVPENVGNLEPLLQSGVFGIKAFLVDSGLNDFKNVDESDLKRGMQTIAKYDMPLLVHAEIETPFEHDDIVDYNTYLKSRPKKWEGDAIKLMIDLCRRYKCRTHIVHLSSQNALSKIRSAKNGGLPFTVETCPHYLVFNAESIPANNTLYKCAPPIREESNSEQLWQAIIRDEIDFITSDHSPAPPELKHLDDHNFKKAWGGIAGLQFLLPAFWTGASAHNIDLTTVCKLLCEAPAEFVGLSKKGKIAPGFDADLVVWDPESNVDTSPEAIHHKHKATPYSDLLMKGNVLRTYVGGELVYQDGDFPGLAKGKVLLKK